MHVFVPRGLWGEVRDQCLLERLDGWGHLDVLASLQSLLTLDQVVDAINHCLHQLDLREGHIIFSFYFLSKCTQLRQMATHRETGSVVISAC